MTKKFTAVSLFSGAGGLDLGFERAGFKTIWANDNDGDSCRTYQRWSDARVICRDVADVLTGDIPKSDIILGGFPCQGFSLSGPRKLEDSRNSLYKHYVRIVRDKKPLLFVGENVKGILTMGNGGVIDAIKTEFAECGYDVFVQLVNASQFGVPQDRERVIITGFRKDLRVKNFEIPVPDIRSTIRDALSGMPEPTADEVCNAPFSSRYMSRNRKRGWDEVAYTVPAMAKQVTLHPSSPDMVKLGTDEWRFGKGGVTRRFSWREVAALQTFPRSLDFYGNIVSKYKQIGNAVPVTMAQYIGTTLFILLNLKGCGDGKVQPG